MKHTRIAIIGLVFAATLLLLAACDLVGLERVDYKVYPTAENPADFFGRVYAKTRTAAIKQQKAATVEEASQLVGFPVRLPTYLPDNLEAVTELIISQAHPYQVDVNLDEALALLQSAGIPGNGLPSTTERFLVDATLAAGVITSQGSDGSFVTFIQTRNPTITLPSGLAPGLLEELGRLGWQYLGLTPGQAFQLNQRLNWAFFLALPPADMDAAESVTVNGEAGVALQTSDPTIPHRAILWEEDGILYGMYSSLPLEEIIRMAESLK